MKHLVFFDFDGVILDSYQTAFGTQKLLCPHLTEEQYRGFFEGNIFDVTAQGDAHTELCRHGEQYNVEYFEHYIPRLKRDGRLVPGMDAAVRALGESHTLVVVSSGQEDFIRSFLAGHDLLAQFADVMGYEVHGSKEEKIKMALATHAIDASQCVFITDTLGDIREAAKMQVGAIGVTWGFHEAERLNKGKPFRLADTPEALVESVGEYFDRPTVVPVLEIHNVVSDTIC